METKHTPGPWYSTYDYDRESYLVSQQPEGGTFWVAEAINGVIGSEAEANARLIAAAPELLDALQDAMRWFAKLEDWRGVGDPNIEKYRAAIAKATGRE